MADSGGDGCGTRDGDSGGVVVAADRWRIRAVVAAGRWRMRAGMGGAAYWLGRVGRRERAGWKAALPAAGLPGRMAGGGRGGRRKWA